MGLLVELCLNFVSRITGSPTCLLVFVLGEWIATLDHESLDDTMKSSAIVKPRLGQLLEVLDRLRRNVRPKLSHHFTFARFDYRYFLFAWFIHWGRFLFCRCRCRCRRRLVLAPQRGRAKGQSDHATKQCKFHGVILPFNL